MKIDLFTIIIQLINFFILMWLLKRFLYKPIVKAMDDREKAIQHRLNAGKEEKAAAEAERLKLLQMQEDFSAQKAKEEDELYIWMDSKRQNFDVELAEERKQKRELVREGLIKESEQFYSSMKEKVAVILEQQVSNALRDLSNESFETRIVNNFISHLSKKDFLVRNGVDLENVKHISVLTSGAISNENKKLLVEFFGHYKKDVKFSSDSARALGIEILFDSNSVAWNIDSYVKNFKDAIDGAINETYKAVKS